ncbi:hypothetical protein ES332_D12G105700v1 [Gossypium tomentosum]|uniref:Uncharacterized protein n=1 Tax=Gossypium tomentosum TaxID=34277 RepID=A0A5D2I8Z3_GOSTO|nr:hypothetical protein ES332_D12G105700v1 [Gossypium tomentosum]
MLRRSCALDLRQDSDCHGDGQRSGGQVRSAASGDVARTGAMAMCGHVHTEARA